MEEGFYAARVCEELMKDGSTRWYADHPDLAGCHAVGDTVEETLERLGEAREAWLKWAREQGVPIPAALESPQTQVQYAIRPDASAPVRNEGETSSQRIPVHA